MAVGYHVRCEGCGYEDRASGRSDYAYRLAEEPDVFLHTQHAWCRQCGLVVQAEDLLSARDSELWMAGTKHPRLQTDARRYREMVDARRSPPRCLRCGSVDIQPRVVRFEEDGAFWTIPHLPCGGELVVTGEYHAHHIDATDVYTPEGEFLERVDSLLMPGRGYI